jgi:polyhydroxyalkanoate synthesis regulator phasin
MFELLRKAVVLGLGAIDLSEKKIKEVVDDLVKRGEIKKSEGAKLIDEVLKKAEKSRAEIEKKIQEGIRTALHKIDIVQKKDLDAKVKNLEKKIEQLKKKVEK